MIFFTEFSVKTNYYKLARLHHPDRVDALQKEVSKEKFSILHHAYTILSNAETKQKYDSGDFKLIPATNLKSKWDHFIKITDSRDIEIARKNYQGSLKEQNDIIREVIIGNGSMTHLLNVIPFMRNDDEICITEFIKQCFIDGKIQKMSIKKLRK